MPKADAVRWNARYRERCTEKSPTPRDLLVRFHHLINPGSLVLDMAMGTGINAEYLVDQGCRVVGVDISTEGVALAKSRCSSLMPIIADAINLHFPINTFDAILNFYFLDRSLFGLYAKVLKHGGFLFFETPSEGTDPGGDSFPREYLLRRNELFQKYPSWDILYRNRERIQSGSHRFKIIEKVILRKV